MQNLSNISRNLLYVPKILPLFSKIPINLTLKFLKIFSTLCLDFLNVLLASSTKFTHSFVNINFFSKIARNFVKILINFFHNLLNIFWICYKNLIEGSWNPLDILLRISVSFALNFHIFYFKVPQIPSTSSPKFYSKFSESFLKTLTKFFSNMWS